MSREHTVDMIDDLLDKSYPITETQLREMFRVMYNQGFCCGIAISLAVLIVGTLLWYISLS